MENLEVPPAVSALSNEPTPKLAEALAKAQGSIEAPAKTKLVDFINNKNQRVKYNYADLADLIACIRKPLSENGLWPVHQIGYFEETRGYGMRTTLMHSSGESISTWYPLPDPMSEIKPQEFGSALTYARRYSLSALLGIASEEDDDGQNAPPAASNQKPPAAKQESKPKANAPKITPPKAEETPEDKERRSYLERMKLLFAIADDCKWTQDDIKAYMLEAWEIDSTKKLDSEKFEMLLDVIRSLTPKAALAELNRD